jgi:hypothetical protein
MQSPNVFVSYSHDSPEHKNWVCDFAELLVVAGVDAVLDQWHLRPGQDIVSFMNHGLARADRVLLICTESYVEKSETGTGGVGYERLIVSSEIAAKSGTDKFIPIIRNNSEARIPSFLGSRMYIDLRNDAEFDSKLVEIIHAIHGVPLRARPPLGKSPFEALIAESQDSEHNDMAARLQQFAPRISGLHQLNQALAGGSLDFV